MDRLADLLQYGHQSLELKGEFAMDVARRLDLVSDSIDRNFGLKGATGKQPSAPNQGFDPNEISKTESGALEHDADEPYMAENFTESESNELLDKQVSGQLQHADKMAHSPGYPTHGFNLFAE
jgi:hypothetical protein